MAHPLFLSVLPAATLAFLACAGPADRGSKGAATVTIAYCCGREAINPSHDMDAKFLVFLPLMTRDQNGRLVGRLARSWEHSADYREWTYHLRRDVRWHDGVPVTARDIAFTIDVMRFFGDLDYGAGAFESVTVHDDSTVTIRSGHGRRLYQTWMVFYPKHLLEGRDPTRLAEWEFWARPVGNGPYRFVRIQPETMMEFEANPDFYLGKPRIERVILKFSLDAGLTELLSGDVDAVGVAPAELPKLSKDPRFRVYHGAGGSSTWAIYWKNDHPLFHDPRVRRALTLAIDRRELLGLLNLPVNLPLFDGPFTPDQYRREELPEPLAFDPAQARALLDSAGWRDEDGDGIREREGREFRFTALIRTFSSENQPGNESVAVYVQSRLRRVGVAMELQPLDPSVVTGRLESGNFEAVFSWLRVYETAWLQRFRFGGGPPIGYRNARVVKLIDLARHTWVPEEEDRIYSELMGIFRADMPVTFLYPPVGLTVAHRRLRGLSTPWRYEPEEHMEELWLEDEPIAQEPAYAPGTGPTVLIDAAHHNVRSRARTTDGGWEYHSLFETHGKWLEEDGYRVRELRRLFDLQSLDDVQIVIIATALSAQNALPSIPPTETELAEAWRLPTPSAFSAEEIAILSEWVIMGGALLLDFDHMPTSGAAQELAEAFGIEVSNGFAVDERVLQRVSGESVGRAGSVIFRRVDQALAEHPVTNGRGLAERVDSVALYVGSAFRLPPGGQSLLTLSPSFVSLLPEVAWEFSEVTPRKHIGGWSQGGVLRVGRGRVAVFSEHGILVTPDMLANPAKAEQNPQVQNPQLLRNVLHWLSGLLDERQ